MTQLLGNCRAETASAASAKASELCVPPFGLHVTTSAKVILDVVRRFVFLVFGALPVASYWEISVAWSCFTAKRWSYLQLLPTACMSKMCAEMTSRDTHIYIYRYITILTSVCVYIYIYSCILVCSCMYLFSLCACLPVRLSVHP